jgi:hypothetical protein
MRSVLPAAAILIVAALSGCGEQSQPAVEIETPKANVKIHSDGDAVDVKTKPKSSR